jgi:hypothetical protein
LFSLGENLKDVISQLSYLENEILSGAFSEVEIKEAIFQMESNKAPGPDGFPSEFYQYLWETIKPDLIALLMSSMNVIFLFVVSTLQQLLFYRKEHKQQRFNSSDPSAS